MEYGAWKRGSVDVLMCGCFHAPTEPPEKVRTWSRLRPRRKYCDSQALLMHSEVHHPTPESEMVLLIEKLFLLQVPTVRAPVSPWTFQDRTYHILSKASHHSVWPLWNSIYKAGSQDMPRPFWNTRDRYLVLNNPPLYPVLSQMSPVHIQFLHNPF